MSDVLILGPHHLLAIHFAAQLLVSGRQQINWLIEDLDDSIAEELRTSVEVRCSRRSGKQDGAAVSVAERLNLFAEHNQQLDAIKADEVWFLAGQIDPPGMARTKKERGPLSSLAKLLEICGAQTLNYVGSIYGRSDNGIYKNGLPGLNTEEREIFDFCSKRSIRSRFFLTGWLLGDDYIAHSQGGDADKVFRALNEVIAEIQERAPAYFDCQALRIVAPESAAINVVHMEHAVQLMLDIAAEDKGSDSPEYILSAQKTPWREFCELLGEVYGVSLLPVSDAKDLNGIDRLLANQLSGLESAWTGGTVSNGGNTKPSLSLGIDQDTQEVFLGSIRQKQERAREARNERAAALAEKMQKRTIPRNGSDLTYYIAGNHGDYILVLNALGHPLEYWNRIIDIWMRKYRVVIWETRGLSSESESLRLSDHVDDIAAILRQEQIESCHLVGWCTGAQAAVEFYATNPEPVKDMLFLSCVFKIPGHPELETAYNRNLDVLCQAMINKPAMTGSIRRALFVPPPSDVNLHDDDTKKLATQVLSLTNIHLRNLVLAPFRTETSTFNYAGQILDLSTHRTFEHAAKVQVPVLVVGCEVDQAAAAEKSRAVAGVFSTSCHVELPGATHYSFYDRPELVAKMADSFFQESRDTVSREEAPLIIAS